jgi:NADH-quinone oxidoreductase subunit N
MLAYSTIAHMGFMLLGLLSGVVEGNRLSAPDAYSSALFYIIVYVLMSLGAFGVLLFCSRAGFECENLDDVKGLNRTHPWVAFLMLLLMFSLAGIPPMAGFYAKLAVLSAAVNAGYLWLAIAAVIFSLIGAFYYLRVVKLMYFDDPKDATRPVGSAGFGIALSVNGLALLLLGLAPWPLMNACFEAIKAL